MTNGEVNNFLDSRKMVELHNKGSDVIKIITVNLEALGYDKNWLIEVLEPRLKETYGGNTHSFGNRARKYQA